jgi:hypothetical protein
MQCESRNAKKEPLFFGDGINIFYAEGRCSNTAIGDSHICNKCLFKNPTAKDQLSRRFQHGLVTELLPETSHIFGPTSWFLNAVKLYGMPSLDVLKTALEAHRVAVGAEMPPKNPPQKQQPQKQQPQKQQPQALKYIEELPPNPQLLEVKEVKKFKLELFKHEKKYYYKDSLHNLVFERNKDNTVGSLVVLSPT